ncbi:hypothetical protein EFK50_01165 [Nocardioides marmoriginsengisoli]|uniref:Uncharacterized protein n=1 Tax=Nocardioides marmoriginsengisoli TaxID=661483 RepID=A0A3N0CTD4_9ACTN|nr:hypothetical protein [Nocardioides marmoriginsengisoli]RNL66266.1 hypothetical protein EFK50_01165 [Nocardioides marmoriginsengisoli]
MTALPTETFRLPDPILTHVIHLRIQRGTNTPEASIAKGTVEEVATEILRDLQSMRRYLDVRPGQITRDPVTNRIIRYEFAYTGTGKNGTETWDNIVMKPARPYRRRTENEFR